MLPYEPIGLDLSLTSTGIAAGDQTWAIDTKGMRDEVRLIYIRDRVLEAVENLSLEYRDRSPIAIIEGYSFASRNSHAHALGELGGIIRVALYEENIPFVEIPPTCRAKFATGRGNAGKSEVVSSISARTGLIWEGAGNEDRCDAWILQEIGYTQLGRARYDWPETNLKALLKIEWPLVVVL